MHQLDQSRAARRRALLSGTAFAGVLLAGVAGQADGALAACTFSDTYTFSCGSMVSTPADWVAVHTGGVTTGTIEAGATISQAGLAVNAGAGSSLDIVNNGTVTGSLMGLGLAADGGNVTYSGNGSASATLAGLAPAGLAIGAKTGFIAVGTADTPVVPHFSGPAGLWTQTDIGPISVFLNGGSLSSFDANGGGLVMQGGGNVSAALTGGTTITNAGTAGTGYGIIADSISGSASVTSDANIGSAANMFGNGIGVTGGSGNVTLSQTGGTIYAATIGSVALGAGAVNVMAAGTISGGVYGIVAASLAGTVTVTAAGTISDTQNGIVAQGLDRTDVAVSGTITADDIGIFAVGTHVGVSVGNGATVQGTNRGGVSVQASDSLIENNGTITGIAGVGSAIGTATVNNAGSIIGTSGIAVYLVGGADNIFVMSGPNATLSGVAIGSGTDTFRLAGSGSNSFDVGQIDTGWVLLDKTGSSDWSLTGTSTYSGPVTVSDGTLSVDGDLNSMSGATVTGGRLVVNSDLTWASGVAVNGGRLSVNGTLHGPVSVAAGGTLGGSGTIDGGAMVDGALSAGNSPGTLTVVGDLTLGGGSTSVFELNTPGVVGGTGAGGNDLVRVGNNLTLGGTLDARVAAAGFYQLFTYGGTLSGSFAGATATGTGGFVPAPGVPDVVTGIAHQVNLSVLASGQTMQFWDGADAVGNGTVDGGAGIWSTAATNWTGAPGHAAINGTWGGSVGVFTGAAGGAVTVSGTQSFDTLQISTNGYTFNGGSLALSPASGGAGTLNVDGGISTTIASAIVDGTGTVLKKAGGGTLVLTGANTYGGGTQLVGGTLSVSSDGNLGAASGALTIDGGTLQNTAALTSARNVTLLSGGGILQADADLTLTGAVAGGGTLTKAGAGTLRLSGANSYGGTVVSAGTLIGNAGSISGDIANDATVVFEQAAAGTFAGAIGGSGAMVKQGAGALTLAGTSTLDWSIEDGGLATAAERFGGDAEIGSGASLTFDEAANAAYGGAFSGTGRFVKAGSGTLAYDGAGSSFTGTTDVSAGGLIVGSDAAHASAVLGGSFDIAGGALLGGHGTVGSGAGSMVTIASGGTLSPGNSIGTLTVNGDLALAAGSTYLAEIAGASSDKTVVTGTASLGGKVAVDPLERLRAKTTYTILTAGTASGAFSGVDFLTATNFARNPRLTYAGNDVLLTLDPGLLSPILPGNATFNQKNVAAGIDNALIGGTTLPDSFNALFALSDNPLLDALSQLSGEIHASAKGALLEDSRFLRDAVNERLRAAFDGVGAAATPVLAYGETGKDGGATAAVGHALAPADTGGVAAWGSVFGSWSSMDGDGNAAKLSRSAGGFFTGIDGL
ncbi:MAG: autotransporter-associated beta strand repeat-containing protein, partial [Mesorhizobium sp.]